MASDLVSVTEGTGKNMSSETVTTLNGASVSSRDIQRVAVAVVTADGVASDVTTANPLPVSLPSATITALTPPAAISGFATEANQTTELASLASILAKLSADPATQTTLAAILAKIIAAPATEAKQDALSALIGEVQASPTSLTLLDRLKSIQTALAGSLTVTANIGTVGTLATAAKQDTGNTSVASIDTKTPALGQAVAAASVPVVLTAAQITTLTPPAAISNFATATLQSTGNVSLDNIDTKLGANNTQNGIVTETAPATDTASSGLNGRLQRIAQNITTLFGRFVAAATLADGTALPSTTTVGAVGLDYNGTTLDLRRGNTEGTALASGVRAATTSSADFVNYNGRGILLYFNVTVAPGTDTVQCCVQTKDPVSGTYMSAHVPTAVATTGFRVYSTYPGGGTGNFTAGVSVPFGRTWRVQVIHNAATNFTYSVGYALVA